MRFLSNGIDLVILGSRDRCALPCCLLSWPKRFDEGSQWAVAVMLLDEIMAELDETRRADLLAYWEIASKHC